MVEEPEPRNFPQPIPLDARKQQILKAVVADYTRTGVPVGSNALAAHLVSWSSATIRNELASLVDIGYLLQPHTSAGRVPSDLGYRYYVDFLMEEEPIPSGARRQMEPFFANLPVALEDLLEVAAAALAQVTEAVSLVTGPKAAGAKLKHLDLVSLDPDNALVMLVLEGNLIRQQAVSLSRAADQEALSTLAGELNTELRGLNATEIAAHPSQRRSSLRAEITRAVVDFMEAVDARQDTLIVHDGFRNLLRQPEFEDIERLHQVLELVEEERILGELLATMELGHGVSIMIGRESGVEQLRQCSLVMTTYHAGGTRWGTIGILGPTRMRYSLVAPRVRYVARRVEQALTRFSD